MKAILGKLIGSLAFVAAIGLGGVAQANEEWNDLDADNNGDITEEEWQATYDYEPVYDEWDADNDGTLTEDEFGTGLYDTYDTDEDGVWDEDEYGLWADDAGDDGFWDI